MRRNLASARLPVAGPEAQAATIVADDAMAAWDRAILADVWRALKEYDRLGPETFFAAWLRPDHDLRHAATCFRGR
jgi:hypothetical protein